MKKRPSAEALLVAQDIVNHLYRVGSGPPYEAVRLCIEPRNKHFGAAGWSPEACRDVIADLLSGRCLAKK